MESRGNEAGGWMCFIVRKNMKFVHSRRKQNSNHLCYKWKFDILPCPGRLYAVTVPLLPSKRTQSIFFSFLCIFYSGFHLEAHFEFYVYAEEVRWLSSDAKRCSFKIWEVFPREGRQLETSPLFLFSLKNRPVHSCAGVRLLLLGELIGSLILAQHPFFFISAKLD